MRGFLAPSCARVLFFRRNFVTLALYLMNTKTYDVNIENLFCNYVTLPIGVLAFP